MFVLCLLPPLRLLLTEVLRARGEPVFIAGWWLLVVKFFGTLFVGTYLDFNGLYLA